MRRPARRLFTLCSAASLLVCVTASALWVRSAVRYDQFGSEWEFARETSDDFTASRVMELAGTRSARGVITVEWVRGLRLPPDAVVEWDWAYSAAPHVVRADLREGYMWRGAGFGFHKLPYDVDELDSDAALLLADAAESNLDGPTFYGVAVPHWFIVALSAVLPGRVAVTRLRARLRHRAGTCPGCGYDLRGTPVRCPECGAAVPVAAPADSAG